MNKSLNKIKDGILVGIGIILVLGIANAWTNLGTVNTGDGLTATIWNDVIAKINDIGTRTDSINTNNSGNVGIGTSSPSTTLDVNGTLKATNLQVTNSPLTCQKVTSTYVYKGNVTGYGANSCIKRATCSSGYVVTGCSTTDTPFYDNSDRIYNYLYPWFTGADGIGIAGEGCQWNNTFTNASTNNIICDNANYRVTAICCKMN